MAKSLCVVLLSLLGLASIAADYVALPARAIVYGSSPIPGSATYYTAPYLPSACYDYQDEGTMIAASSDSLWENGLICGKMFTIRCNESNVDKALDPCTDASVTVKIVDYCPGCNSTFKLSQEAFQKLTTSLDFGSIKIAYNPTNETNTTFKAQLIYCQV